MARVSKLVDAAMALQFEGFLSFCPPARWVFQPSHLSLLMQIEEGYQCDTVIIFASMARDGSGPMMTSFMTTLLIDEAHSTAQDGLCVASGPLSVTYYIMRSITDMDAVGFLQLLHNFAELVSWSSTDMIMANPPTPPVGDAPVGDGKVGDDPVGDALVDDKWLPRQFSRGKG